MSPQLLAFYVGGRGFVVDVMRVVEIVNDLMVVPLPEGPSFVEGNGLLRGQLLPVLDLQKLLARESLAPGEQPSKDVVARAPGARPIVVVRVNEHVLGLRVERVAEVLRPALDALVPSAPAAPYRSKYAMGVLTMKGVTYTLLDVRPLAAL